MQINIDKEITSRYGNIRRAKGFYLYTEKNIRLTDMYLDGGMSILGRRTNQSNLTFKQFIDRGLIGFLPTKADLDLKKSLNALFPNHQEFRIYNSYNNLEQFIWKPFSPENKKIEAKVGFFVMPPYCTTVKIFIFNNNYKNELPPSISITANEKATLAKSFFYLKKKLISTENEIYFENTQNIENITPKKRRMEILNKIKQYNKIKNLAEPYWEFSGAYLYPKIKVETYKEFFKKALDNKILISPNYAEPSILPNLKHYTELLNFFNNLK